MPFLPPSLPETCDIMDYATSTYRAHNVPCQIVGQDRNNTPYIVVNVNGLVDSRGWLTTIIMPPRQDVRGPGQGVTIGDRVMLPAGQTNCNFIVAWVYDMHRGEPNEFRVAVCTYLQLAAGPLQ
jgi:hypothetical protein